MSNRVDDDKVSCGGQFVCGAIKVKDGAPSGALSHLGADGAGEMLAGSVGIANAPCFSLDGGTLCLTQSRVGTICVWSCDCQAGEVGAWVSLPKPYTTVGSAATGATVDAEGFVRGALVRFGQLTQPAPHGRLDRIIYLPVPYFTCPAFNGPALDVLYATPTSRFGRMRSKHPEASRMVAITRLEVCGLPEAWFGTGTREQRL